MMSLSRAFILFLILIVFSLQTSFGATFCSQEPDEFIITCTIPEKYFIQNFTCFNYDCSIMATNNFSFLELSFPQTTEKSVILKNNIQLKELYGNTEILKQLCEEPMSDRTITKLNEKLKGQTKSTQQTFSGEKLLVEPITEASRKKVEIKQETLSDNLFRCYENSIEEIDGWYIESKERRPYCNLVYSNENACLKTDISAIGFAGYVITNPNKSTLPYLISGVLFIVVIASVGYLKFRLTKKRELKEFFRLTNTKIIINSIIIIPILYLYGLMIRNMIKDNTYIPSTFTVEFTLLILGLIITYYLSCVIDYVYEKIKIKRKL